MSQNRIKNVPPVLGELDSIMEYSTIVREEIAATSKKVILNAAFAKICTAFEKMEEAERLLKDCQSDMAMYYGKRDLLNP